jgi:hypothetical protein
MSFEMRENGDAISHCGFGSDLLEKGTVPEKMEIIEIGAVMLKSAAGPVCSEFSKFVKPAWRLHPPSNSAQLLMRSGEG